MKKMWTVILVLAAIIVAVIVVVAMRTPTPNVGDPAKLERTFTPEEQHLIDTRRITVDELASNDGDDGRPAWVAIAGVVYDMSSLKHWRGGRHHGVRAGTDATEAFLKSGHAVDKLQLLPVVGGLEAPR